MALTRSVKETMPGFGHPTEVIQSQDVNNPINATTTTTLSTVMLASFKSGKIRIKGFAYPGAGAGQCTAIKVTATDGVTTVVIRNITTFAASEFFDILIDFLLDQIAATSVSIAVTMANVANGQLTTDFELACNP